MTPPLTLAQALAAGGVTLPLHLGHEEIGDVIDDAGRLVLTTDVGHRRPDREVISTAALVVAAVNACGGHPAERAQTPAAVPAGYGMRELEDVRVACLARVDAAAQRAEFTPWQRAFAAHLVAEISSSIKDLSLPVGHRPNGPPHPAPAQEPVAFVDMQFITKSRADFKREGVVAYCHPAGTYRTPVYTHPAPAQEPVAWQRRNSTSGWIDCRVEDVERYRAIVQEIRALGVIGAHPAPAQEPVAVPEVEDLIERLLDAQQDINLAANTYMSQSLCDASALIDKVETVLRRTAAPVSPPAESGEVNCQKCAGNGEIVADWGRYLEAKPGDVGDEAVAECPECSGTGKVDAAPQPADHRRALDTAPAWPELDALFAEAKAQAPQPGGAVKVKALEWVDRGQYSAAASAVGGYEAYDDEWWFREEHEGTAPNRDAAKAAAQADYERRILSAIEPFPVSPPTDHSEDALDMVKAPPAESGEVERLREELAAAREALVMEQANRINTLANTTAPQPSDHRSSDTKSEE